MTKLVKEELLNEVYDLVLSVDIKDEERQALLTFKNAVEAGQDFDRAVMSLASDLRRIGVANIAKKTKMSASVNTFYQKSRHMENLKKSRTWSYGYGCRGRWSLITLV